MALVDRPVCDFGAALPDFSLRDAKGEVFTRDGLMRDKGLLVMFICNHCPYVKRIAQELARDTSDLISAGVGVVAIMSNDYRDYPADAPDKMVQFAAEHGFEFPYLVDEDQSVGRAFGAVCTPDFFGYNAAGTLQYRGNMAELKPAMMMIAETGAGPQAQTPSMGCSIKWS